MSSRDDRMGRLQRLRAELERRRVVRVAVVYLVAAWALIEASDVVFPALRLPEWTVTFVVVLALLGFPAALVLAWAFDLTSEGVQRTEPADSLAPARGGAAAGRMPRGARAVTVVTTVLVTVLLTVAGLKLLHRPDAAGAASPTTLAVLPFSVRGGDEFGYLREGMVNLLSTKLDGAGPLRSVDARALLGTVSSYGPAALDPERGREVASRFGAGLFVLGEVVEASGILRITASLYEADGGTAVGDGAVAEGEAADVFGLVDQLAAQLLKDHGGGAGARVERIAAVTTTSLPALKAYLEGQSELRAGRFGPAVEAFQRSVAADTLFALGYYRLALAAEWLTWSELALDAAESAVRHAGRLAPRDRHLLDAFVAWWRGEHGEAERAYRSLLGSYPDDVEAWWQLGEILFHANPMHGRPMAESRPAFERVLEYEPDHAGALVHLARLAAADRRLVDLDSIVDRIGALNPAGDRDLEMRALRAFSGDDGERKSQVLADLERASDVSLALAGFVVALWGHDLDGAATISRSMTLPSRSPQVRALGHAYLAHIALARGRWSEAQRELDALGVVDRDMELEFRALLSTLPFLPVREETLRGLRAALDRPLSGTQRPGDSPSLYFSAHDVLLPVTRPYLQGLLSARLGDERDARARADEMYALEGPLGAGTLAEDLAHGIRAEVALTRGDDEEALASLERVRGEVMYHHAIGSSFASAARERYLRGELLAGVGRDEEALGWLANLVATSPLEVPYLPLAHLRRAEITERLGRPEEAARHYAAFIALWADCDPELRPLLEVARRRLAGIRPG